MFTVTETLTCSDFALPTRPEELSAASRHGVCRQGEGGASTSPPEPERSPHGHWLMVTCCVPMLVVAVVIAVSGAGWSFFVVAVGCVVMMLLMMMSALGGESEDESQRRADEGSPRWR